MIGLLPLATHYIVVAYTKIETHGDQAASSPHLSHPPLAEMNILTVVISGLGLLSLLKFGHHGRKSRLTPMTYLAALAALVLLIAASLLYALTTAGIGVGNENVTYAVLLSALSVSFYLALEPAWLEALNES